MTQPTLIQERFDKMFRPPFGSGWSHLKEFDRNRIKKFIESEVHLASLTAKQEVLDAVEKAVTDAIDNHYFPINGGNDLKRDIITSLRNEQEKV